VCVSSVVAGPDFVENLKNSMAHQNLQVTNSKKNSICPWLEFTLL